jgi:hypothetical protein
VVSDYELYEHTKDYSQDETVTTPEMENATSTDYCRGYEGLIKREPEEHNDQNNYKMRHQSK